MSSARSEATPGPPSGVESTSRRSTRVSTRSFGTNSPYRPTELASSTKIRSSASACPDRRSRAEARQPGGGDSPAVTSSRPLRGRIIDADFNGASDSYRADRVAWSTQPPTPIALAVSAHRRRHPRPARELERRDRRGLVAALADASASALTPSGSVTRSSPTPDNQLANHVILHTRNADRRRRHRPDALPLTPSASGHSNPATFQTSLCW